jgi:hypothetical protein
MVILVVATGAMVLTLIPLRAAGAVVGLAEVPEEPGGAGGEDDPAVLLLPHDRPRRLGRVGVAEQVDADDGVEVVELHLGEGAVPEVAGVVHHDVDRAVGVDGGLHELLATVVGGHVAEVGHRLAAGGADLGHDGLGHVLRRPSAVELGAEVVDDHVGTEGGEPEGVAAPEPPSRARHHGDLAVESDRHGPPPIVRRRPTLGGERKGVLGGVGQKLRPVTGGGRRSERSSSSSSSPGPVRVSVTASVVAGRTANHMRLNALTVASIRGRPR